MTENSTFICIVLLVPLRVYQNVFVWIEILSVIVLMIKVIE